MAEAKAHDRRSPAQVQIQVQASAQAQHIKDLDQLKHHWVCLFVIT